MPTRGPSALERARQGGFDTIVYGHLHFPGGAQAADGTAYVNGGDWVEHFSAAVMDEKGGWKVVEWPTLRQEMRRDGTLSPRDAAAERVFRPQTEQMVAAVRAIWPGATPGAAR